MRRWMPERARDHDKRWVVWYLLLNKTSPTEEVSVIVWTPILIEELVLLLICSQIKGFPQFKPSVVLKKHVKPYTRTNHFLLSESEVCTGNIKLRPCYIDRVIGRSMRQGWSSLMSVSLYGTFSKIDNNSEQVEILYFAHGTVFPAHG